MAAPHWEQWMGWLSQRLARNKARCLELRNRWYPVSTWPGTLYVECIRQQPGESVLEIGCGRRASVLLNLADRFPVRVGIDPDCEGVESPDPGVRLSAGGAEKIPEPDTSFDVIAMKNTAEHLADPAQVFRECRRVLKPGGRLIVQTVNAWFPPIAMTRWMPWRLRVAVNGLVSGTAEADTFPVYYRANTLTALRRAGQEAGLNLVSHARLSQHPVYFLFSPLVYRAAAVVEGVVRRSNALAGLRHILQVVFERPAQ